MDSAYTRYQELLFIYGERISNLGIDKLEETLDNMKKCGEKWGGDFSLSLSQEIRSRGHEIDYDNYKIIYHNEEKKPKRFASK